MFDIGFTEILVIATIALVVVGPERLPGAVRAVSLWIGRLKRSLRETRRELEQQFGADDIRRELHNEEIMRSLEKIQHDVSDTLNQEINVDDDAQLYPPGHHDKPHITDPLDAEEPTTNSIAPPNPEPSSEEPSNQQKAPGDEGQTGNDTDDPPPADKH